MAADWYVDHRRHLAGQADPSKMIAERNGDRHALNRRAQALLRNDGLLHQPVTIGDTEFHIGERVVAQARNSDLLADGADRRDHVINGSEGTIIAITGNTVHTRRRRRTSTVSARSPSRTTSSPPRSAPAAAAASHPPTPSPRSRPRAKPSTPAATSPHPAPSTPKACTSPSPEAATTNAPTPSPPTTSDSNHPNSRSSPTSAPLSKRSPTPSQSHGAPTSPRSPTRAAHAVATDANRPLAETDGRARTLAEQRIAAAAIQTPDDVTVAALGPRPPVGAHRRLWDHAVGEAAIYRARWDTDTVTIDGGVAEPVPGDGTEKYEHYDRVQHAVLAADVEHLANVPLADLATEHVALRAAQPNSPSHDHPATERRLAEAEQSLHGAQQRLRRAERPDNPIRRPSPLDRELKRRSTEDARHDVARAQATVDRARQRLEASKGDPASRAAINARIATIDRAFDRRIDAAVARPADYLTHALGQRPRHHGDRERWNAAAHSIENYRHRHLHITPGNGALGSAPGLDPSHRPQTEHSQPRPRPGTRSPPRSTATWRCRRPTSKCCVEGADRRRHVRQQLVSSLRGLARRSLQ